MAQAPNATISPDPQPRILFSRTPEHFPRIPHRGQWEDIGGVGVLRDATSIPKNAAAAQAVYGGMHASETDSLPDIWSQVEGFADALYQENHERHVAAVVQWRGLLACLALAGDSLPNLLVRRIDLTAPTPFMRTASILPLRQPFLSNLYNDGIGPRVAIDEVATIHLRPDHPPLALLEPVTFIAPARSVREAVTAPNSDNGVPWVTTHGIEDPTTHRLSLDRLSRAQYEILARYLQRLFVLVHGDQQNGGLRGRLTAPGTRVPPATRARVEALADLLDAYRGAARSAAQRRGRETGHGDTQYIFSQAPQPRVVNTFSDPLYGIRFLQHFAETSGGPDFVSHTQVNVRSEATGLFKAVVLADPQTALADPRHVVVLDQTTVLHLQEQADRAAVLKRTSLSRNILVVTPDDLFTNTLVQVTNGLVPGHALGAGGGATLPLSQFVLPLTPLALLLLNNLVGEDARLKLVSHNDNEVEASLTVPLKGSTGGEERALEVKKIFRKSGAGAGRWVEAAQAEVLALWPNLEDRDWNAFHIYSVVAGDDRAVGPSLVPLWPLQAATLADKVRGSDQGEDSSAAKALRLLSSWTQIRRLDQELPETKQVVMEEIGRGIASGIVDRRLLQIPARPEAYMVAAGMPADLRNRRMEELGAAGIVLIPSAPVNRGARGEVMDVGLDFGSTNTTLFVKGRGDTEPKRVTFEGRRLDVLRTASDPGFEGEFASITARPIPISTVLAMRFGVSSDRMTAAHIGGGLGSVADVRAIFPALVAYLNNPGNFKFSIKWMPDQIELSEYFLRDLVLLFMAEATVLGVDVRDPNAIRWHVSYPSAYSGNHYRQFTQAVRGILGYLLPHDAPPPPIHQETESVCAARYFREHGKGAAYGTTVILDIGGGTSDMAIWQHRSEAHAPLVWQSSVRFAGQQLVVEPIAHNVAQFADGPGVTSGQSILEVLARQSGLNQSDFASAVSMLREKARTSEAAALQNAVGVAINSEHFARTIGGAFAGFASNPANGRVFDVTAVGFAGILWFIGRQMRAMLPSAEGIARDDSTPPPVLDPNLTGSITVCLAGRPSQLIKAMEANRHGYTKAFGEIVRAAAMLPAATRVTVEYTEAPKSEVAFGLLSPNLEADMASISAGTILGEAVVGARNTLVPGDRVLPPMRSGHAMQIHNTAPEMEAFLRCVTSIVTDTRAGDHFVELPSFEHKLAEWVDKANGAMDAAAGRDAAAKPVGGDVAAAMASGAAPLTIEVQPPFFALLNQVMRAMV